MTLPLYRFFIRCCSEKLIVGTAGRRRISGAIFTIEKDLHRKRQGKCVISQMTGCLALQRKARKVLLRNRFRQSSNMMQLKGRGQFKYKGLGAALECSDVALALLFLVVFAAPIHAFLARRGHEVHHAGQLVGDRGVGPGLVRPGIQPTVEVAQCRIAAGKRHGGHLQRLAGPVGGVLASGRKDLAVADFGPRAQPAPGTEVFDVGEIAGVGCDLRQQGQYVGDPRAVDLDQIDAGPVG